jgi:alpha-tubulin suppressor-like RCC1 family protein
MKKVFLFSIMLLTVLLGLSLRKEVKAELLPVVGNPYSFELDLEFQKTASGEAHTIGLSKDGKVYAWGWNQYGQLGIGTTISSYIPIDITENLNLNSGEVVIDVATGINHSSVITSEGRLLIWGYNVYWALGDGTSINRLLPIDITAQFNLDVGEKVVYSENGYYFSGAITSDGRVFTWGQGYSGQLGSGSNADAYFPQEITNNFGLMPEETVVKLMLGSSHAIAITSLERVFSWGYNQYGQLGDGTTINKNLPIEITPNIGLVTGETIIDLETFHNNTGVVTSLGRILMWGENNYVQIGDGTYIARSNPTDISAKCNLSPEEIINDLSIGIGHTGALTSNNRVLMWGYNGYYQLGDGTNTQKNLPVDITSRFTLEEGEVNVALA